MKREEILERLGFTVPQSKKKRVIIHSDIAAEADDVFAVVHHLLTPTEDVRGIVAGNFEWRYRTFPGLKDQRLTSMERSYEEGKKLLALMEMDDVPVFRGAPDQITDKKHLPVSEGSEFIVEEAMRDTEEPLYIALQGTLTDLAVAYLTKPEIAERITAAIWIGGSPYPQGGRESNMQQDVYASQVIFDSPIPLWQIPVNAYGCMTVTFAELMTKVYRRGRIGKYLCENMFAINDWYGKMPRQLEFPHGEVWSIGDQPTVSALLEPASSQKRRKIQAPRLTDDMQYQMNPEGKEMYVYDEIDRRVTMEDLFAKLELCYGNEQEAVK